MTRLVMDIPLKWKLFLRGMDNEEEERLTITLVEAFLYAARETNGCSPKALHVLFFEFYYNYYIEELEHEELDDRQYVENRIIFFSKLRDDHTFNRLLTTTFNDLFRQWERYEKRYTKKSAYLQGIGNDCYFIQT